MSAIKETVKIPKLTWETAKSLIIPRVSKELERHSSVAFKVKNIVGEGFPDPTDVVVQDRTNGWSAYYNITMKLFPVIEVVEGGKHIEKKLPYPIVATIGYNDAGSWHVMSFMLITNQKAAQTAQQLNF